ncbi:MAG: hypothetical protein SPJ01_06855, partial [Butyricicoccus sp.]|nr:hypothetical protein [Butyricicoccus sp.]
QKRHPSGCLFCFGQVISVDSKGGSYKRAGGTFEPPALIENRAQHGNKDSDLRAGPAAAGRIHHLPYPPGCLFCFGQVISVDSKGGSVSLSG